MSVRVVHLAVCLLSFAIDPLTALDAFPRIPSLVADTHDHLLLRSSLFFASPSHEVVHVRLPQHGCNSERLRAVLQQSVSDNGQRSVWAILSRLHDSQFSVRCTADGTPPILHRRALFCQLTVGRTTCAVTTGTPHSANSSIMILRSASIFRPRPQKSERVAPTRPPVQEVDELSQILATMPPEVSRKKRSDGMI
ncbi:hypothetical protein PRIPAC_93066 [Pristionchus pacificus]|uniref:Uncharacterized protein n=1 Tax=Pristionchus pacificus TaxID=54126 RepID=A0A2A6CE20_PRIPA|nr:hypothetical protein PRIPAC_93066 [Pristionchus pacificus]|eukprot:PDM76357.1 hypothetical protein PRIPAC_39961 [Pristionchus pacificus]